MTVCSVDVCEQEATKTIRATASLGCWNAPYKRYVMDEVEMDVPLCDGHYDLLTQDALKGLSVG